MPPMRWAASSKWSASPPASPSAAPSGRCLAGVLLGGTFIAITALGLQTARQLAPQAPRRIFALMTASFGLGQIVGPIVAGLLAQASGNFFLASIVAAAVLLVVSGAITWSAAPKSP